MNINSKSFIIVTGPPRSGTTLINRLLCSYKECSPLLPECSFLTKHIEIYSQIISFSDNGRFDTYFGNITNCKNVFKECIESNLDGLFYNKPDLHNFNYIVLKDPMLSLHLNEAITFFPSDTHWIITTRNPLSVIASMKKVMQKQEKPWDVEKSISDIFIYYYQITEFIKKNTAEILIQKYEDIVNLRLSALEEYLGFTLEGVHLENSHNEFNSHDPFCTQLSNKNISNEKIDSWKTELSKKEISLVNRYFSGIISFFNYSL